MSVQEVCCELQIDNLDCIVAVLQELKDEGSKSDRFMEVSYSLSATQNKKKMKYLTSKISQILEEFFFNNVDQNMDIIYHSLSSISREFNLFASTNYMYCYVLCLLQFMPALSMVTGRKHA